VYSGIGGFTAASVSGAVLCFCCSNSMTLPQN